VTLPDLRSIDELAAAANRDRSAEAMGTLWSAAFAAESWTLIGRAGTRRFEPLTTTYEHLLCALAFTSHDRASAFAAAEGLRAKASPNVHNRAELVSMPVPAAVDLLDELRSVGVECLLMNEGSAPFIAPLSGLLRLFAVHGGV